MMPVIPIRYHSHRLQVLAAGMPTPFLTTALVLEVGARVSERVLTSPVLLGLWLRASESETSLQTARYTKSEKTAQLRGYT